MSRKNSQEKIICSAQSARNQGRQLNIIDFIMKQNCQDKAPSTIVFSEEYNNKVKSCDMCLSLQEEIQQLVNADRFQQVIEKLWKKIKKIEEENQRMAIKVGNLERALTDQQNLIEELNDYKQQPDTQQQQEQMITQLDKSQMEKLEKKVSKEALAGMKNIEDNLIKLLNKEIQAKFMVMQEKQEEISHQFAGVDEQIQLLHHKHGVTREECDEKIHQIALIVEQNNQFQKNNNQGIMEMTQHYSDMDADIMKIFQHIKTLLQTDYKVAEMEQSINNLKSQLSQLRNAVNEIGDFVSKI